MMKLLAWGSAVVLLLVPTVLVLVWIQAAKARLTDIGPTGESGPAVAVAQAANESYCNPELKKILRRVLQSCGLVGAGGGRGCQPVQARQVATMRGDDFNALFQPMKDRGGIVQFDNDSADLDAADKKMIDQIFADRRGASWFFVVARASPVGSVKHNRDLSRRRAEAVMSYLDKKFQDPDLDKEVGLLWLGEEYAQLAQQYCGWRRSGPANACSADDLNRSAFITWIDCRL